jgi:hypothetical protein
MRLETDIDFSLIIPSRGRVRLLTNCLNSFFKKAKNKENVEAIVLADYDDKSMRDFEQYISIGNIKVVFQNRSVKMIKDYNNYGTQCSTGKYVWIMNDDYEMVTNNWDEIMFNKAESFLSNKPDRIIYIQVDDSTHTKWGKADELGCCCPILSKESVDVQNGIMPSEIDMWGADIWLYRIFKKLPQNRVLNLIDNIKVLHHCRHNNTMPVDETAINVQNISVKAGLSDEEVNKYVNLYSRYLT